MGVAGQLLTALAVGEGGEDAGDGELDHPGLGLRLPRLPGRPLAHRLSKRSTFEDRDPLSLVRLSLHQYLPEESLPEIGDNPHSSI